LPSDGAQTAPATGDGHALWIADPSRVAWSVLGAVVLNLVLAVNHRPGRYMAV